MNLFGNDEQYFSFFYYNLFIDNTNTYTILRILTILILTPTILAKRHYNLKLRKKEPNTIKILVVTKIKYERNQLTKQNFLPYLKETKKRTILL